MSISLATSKGRSITRLAYPVSLGNKKKNPVLPVQRRHYVDEPATQSEPEADGATEAQHGENSIAASADADADGSTFTRTEEAKESAAAEKATEHASSTADSVKSAMQTASEAVTGTAQSLGAAAGFGSQTSEAGGQPPVTTVYVGNLYFDVRSEDLQKEFERAGPVTGTTVVMDQRGLSKGFVTFFPAFFLRCACI